MMKIAVIVPTYNEKENILKLIKVILGLKLNLKLFIVDDNSPDRTSLLVKKSFGKNYKVSLMTRINKGGRGSAVIDGLKKALKDKEMTHFLEMDADFSHNPKDIIKLIQTMGQTKADVVLGSRYLPQSRILEWPMIRHIFSRIANIYARLILNLPISDYTNGYRLYKRHVIESLDFTKIRYSGYIVLSEMAYQIHKKGFRFAEIPIVFVNRRRGVSNLRLKEITDAFISVLRVRFSE